MCGHVPPAPVYDTAPGECPCLSQTLRLLSRSFLTPFARSLLLQGCVGLLPSPARGHAPVTRASLVRIFVYLYSIGVGQALSLSCFALASASEFCRVARLWLSLVALGMAGYGYAARPFAQRLGVFPGISSLARVKTFASWAVAWARWDHLGVLNKRMPSVSLPYILQLFCSSSS